MAIVQEMRKLAASKGCTVAQIALAWVAAQGLIAIPGTTKPGRLEENWKSRNIELSKGEQAALRSTMEMFKPQGNRFGPAHEATIDH